MPQSRFGCGYLYGTPAGGLPVPFAAIQDISIDFNQDLKYLYGSSKFAIEQAGGKAKIECKASVGRVDPTLFNSIYWGEPTQAGAEIGAVDEILTVPNSSPYTVVVANGGSFAVDLAVYDTATQKFMTRMPNAAAVVASGQYSADPTTGTYKFYSGDAGHVTRATYTWTTGNSAGIKILGNNQTLGTVNVFEARLLNSYKGKSSQLRLPACISTKFSLPFKQDDFLIPSFNFSAQDDGTGVVFEYSSSLG